MERVREEEQRADLIGEKRLVWVAAVLQHALHIHKLKQQTAGTFCTLQASEGEHVSKLQGLRGSSSTCGLSYSPEGSLRHNYHSTNGSVSGSDPYSE